jgi:hypothetical protein
MCLWHFVDTCLAFCILYCNKSFLGMLPYYFPLYQLKFEMNCIVTIVKVSLCAKGPQPFGSAHEIVCVC